MGYRKRATARSFSLSNMTRRWPDSTIFPVGNYFGMTRRNCVTLSLVVDILILLLAAYGLVMLFRRKQFGTLVGYGAVLACGYIFLYRDEYYPAYKIVTILWPFFLWIVFLPLSRIFSSPPRLECPSTAIPICFRLCAYRLFAPSDHQPGTNTLSLVPISWSVPTISLPNESLRESFLKPRISDVNRLEQISREVSAKKENVLVIADVPAATPHDFGFAQLFLRNESVFFPKSFGTAGRVWRYAPYPNARAASPHQPIDRVLFLNNIDTFNFHLAERHIFGGTFDETAFRRMNFCADLVLRNREELLILCRSDPERTISSKTDTGRQSYLIEKNELALDIYHINAPVGQAARFSFSITSPNSIPAGAELEVLLDGKVIESANDPTAWTRTVWLSPEAMHQQLVIRIKEKEPDVATSTWRFEIGEFEGATLSRNNWW